MFAVFCIFTTSNQLHAQWQKTNGPDGQIECFAVIDNSIFAGTAGNGVFLSTDNGSSWTAVSTGLVSNEAHALLARGSDLFVGFWGGGVYKSTNYGTTWTQVDTGLTDSDVETLAVSGGDLFAGTVGFWGGVFQSSNDGFNWLNMNDGLTFPIVTSLAISGSNMFAATGGGGVFLSTNGGNHWTPVNTGLTDTMIYTLAINGNNIFAIAGDSLGEIGNIFLSTNNGSSWTFKGRLFPGNAYALAVSGNNIFAAGDGGVFRSSNNGDSWIAENDGLDSYSILINALVVKGDTLFAGTDFDNVWKRSVSEMITSVKNPSTGSPANFSLDQNYPNPFNPTTTITYRIPVVSNVRLEIYDILGREVKALVNERQTAGSHYVTFNAGSLPSGVYIYKLQAGNYSNTKKLLLLK